MWLLFHFLPLPPHISLSKCCARRCAFFRYVNKMLWYKLHCKSMIWLSLCRATGNNFKIDTHSFLTPTKQLFSWVWLFHMPVVEQQLNIVPSASMNVLIYPVFSSTQDNSGFSFSLLSSPCFGSWWIGTLPGCVFSVLPTWSHLREWLCQLLFYVLGSCSPWKLSLVGKNIKVFQVCKGESKLVSGLDTAEGEIAGGNFSHLLVLLLNTWTCTYGVSTHTIHTPHRESVYTYIGHMLF